MSQGYDVIVIGAGHNGLTAAALLGRAGRRVLVLERRAQIGGLAASEEFAPGYRHAGMLSDSGLVRPSVIAELDLPRHGLQLRDAPPSVLALGAEGSDPLLVHGQVDRAAEAIARVCPPDADRYRDFMGLLDRLAPALRELFDRPPIDIIDVESQSLWDLGRRALRVRRLGPADMMELLRLPSMAIADVLGEHLDHGPLRAVLALPALAGTFTGPRSPGNAINLLRHHALRGPGIVGGGPMLIAALRGAAEAAGVEIRTEAPVLRLRTGPRGIQGVTLAGGESLDAAVVAASCHPFHTLGELLPPGAIESRLEHHILTLRSRGAVALVSLALDRAPRLGDAPVEFARTGADLDALERAFDAVKAGRVSPTPVLDIHVPTVAQPALAPDGHAVVCATVYYVPYAREGGWDEAAREALGDRVVQVLGQYDPQLPAHVVGREVLTPVELEARYGICGGQLYHAEHSLDQLLVRPTPECIHYRTPIPGLYLCGSGSHPGGGLTCAPGQRAAQAILTAK